MKPGFLGWGVVATRLRQRAAEQQETASLHGDTACYLNSGQCASLCAIARRIPDHGVVIADEVGMGKTRIAVELTRSVVECGGRVAILVPPGLGFQWQAELRDGQLDVQPALRSLWAYLAAWADEDPTKQKPWHDEKVVVVSHAFCNWRLGERAEPWRWALLPELYARWRKENGQRFPRGYTDAEQLGDPWVQNAAQSIISAATKNATNPERQVLDHLLEEVDWGCALEASEYSKQGNLREWLERSVGLGLGAFDLVVIDEAHKSRGDDSGLARLLDKLLLVTGQTRRLAMTATPVELDISQWVNTLGRIGLDGSEMDTVQLEIERYSEAVKRLRYSWQSSPEVRENFKQAARSFQRALSPYLIRRDKSEDPSVKAFKRHAASPSLDYRQESEILVALEHLSPAWKQAVCAAEALSVVSAGQDEMRAKRLRLTIGNGHGIATLLDQIVDSDQENEADDGVTECEADRKRQARIEWWLSTIRQAFPDSEETLFGHPALLAAVDAIEAATLQGEKVLVFGRFTRPLRALVQLLNARELLRCAEKGLMWPQSKVSGNVNDNAEQSEWPAVRAAHRQLGSALKLEALDDTLKANYEKSSARRESVRERLLPSIEQGLLELHAGQRAQALFAVMKQSALDKEGANTLVLLHRALDALIGDAPDASPAIGLARAFCELVEAATDRDEGDLDHDNTLDQDEAADLWEVIVERLKEEFNRPESGYARLMYGGTSQESRRMIQLAFNRANAFPRVLVAQSMVGREGLNLHKACKIVLILHPEWNPGVVEQQIGRIDRVGSRWSKALDTALDSRAEGDSLPRIQIWPVIFQGTYDQHNWQVLRERWDDLRAQLHGIVVPPRLAADSKELQGLIEELTAAAPRFSPETEWEGVQPK